MAFRRLYVLKCLVYFRKTAEQDRINGVSKLWGHSVNYRSLGICGEPSLNPSQREGDQIPPPSGEARWGRYQPFKIQKSLNYQVNESRIDINDKRFPFTICNFLS